MLKCDTGYLRNSCRWHPPWTKNCDLSAPARKIFSAGLPPRTPPGMNSHLSTVVHTWKTHRIWATCLGDPGPLADDHDVGRDPPCGGLQACRPMFAILMALPSLHVKQTAPATHPCSRRPTRTGLSNGRLPCSYACSYAAGA